MAEQASGLSPRDFNTFGELLRFLRVRAGLSQRDLAARVGYHYSHVNRFEKQQRAPDRATLLAHFIPALEIQNQPEWTERLLELAAQAQEETKEGQPKTESVFSGKNEYRLPASLGAMIGREQETILLAKLLLQEDIRLLTVIGPPGVGKTRTSLHVAEKIAHHFSHGAVFVNLAPVAKASRVLYTLADTLGLVETSAAPSLRMLQSFLRDKNLLIVMDNFEQVLDAAPHMTELLGAAPGVKMLITSREALRIQGEREFPLAPLPLPEDVHLLEESPAVQLFVQRAIAVQPDFQLTPENAPLVMEICRRLDGLPLALELAAARIRSLSLADMLAQFDRLFDWLTRGRRDSPAWRQTLLGAIEWSYGLLTDPERTLLARLAVFSGGWTLEAAEAVCSDERLLKKNRVVDLLSQLVDRSLVVSEPHLGRARYRFLDTIFHFSLSKLEESGKKEELRDRHLDYFSGWAEAAKARLETAPPLELRGQMDAEGNNIRAALEWGLSNKQQTETGLRLVCSAGSVWLKHSHFKEALAWAEKYLPLSNEHPNLKARLLFLATALSYWRDNLQQALTYGAEGAPLAKAVGAYDACAGILCYMGDALRESGQYEAARKNVEEAVTLCREHFRPIRLSMALTSLGIIRYQMGERDFAETHIDEALEIAERENSLWAQSYALRVRADNLRFDGKFADSYRAYEEALSVSREIDDRISVGMELANLSLLANVLGDYSASANYARKALALFQSIGNEYQQPFPQRMLAYALTHEGDIQRARAACMESLNGNRAIGHRTGVIACLVCLASILYAEGNTSAAHGLLSTLQAEIAAHSVKLMEPDAKAFNHLVASLKVRAAPVEEKGGSLVEVLGELGL